MASRENTLAAKLRATGIGVLGVSEADDAVDGEIALSDKTYVQVHTFEPGWSVGRELPNGNFRHYPSRVRFIDLIADIRAALAEEAEEAVGGQAHPRSRR
ncbi:MAG: hypothetical protein K5880_09995 [Hydrogenophaga sp.]|uniref:hypothetical protein n=1 Tax=Hydrogenophaga sp. TaxID=1904254 RepID=UPI002606D6E2|nr:hypothetical protein [Hydrogenophaga sp.]MCV0438953.1 hypothetical protein [Hydrogenophaga sp.]